MKLERFTLVEVEGVKFVVIEDHLASSKMGLRRGCKQFAYVSGWRL
jgi:hypothetical protein